MLQRVLAFCLFREEEQGKAVAVHFQAACASVLQFACRGFSSCAPHVRDEAAALARSDRGGPMEGPLLLLIED